MNADKTVNTSGFQRTRLPAVGSETKTGDQQINFATEMRELRIYNDDVNPILVSVGDFSITIHAKEILDERFIPFLSFSVEASGSWRYIVRSGSAT